MIEQVNPAPGVAGLAWRLRPNRSASVAELVACFSALALAAFGVAFLAAAHGNVFAPLFALLDVIVVGVSFWIVRQGGKREETIALTPDAVTVEVRPGGATASFHPYWVRLEEVRGRTRNEPRRVVLRSHGRTVEIGAFLGEDERATLRDRLQSALAAARAGANGFESG